LQKLTQAHRLELAEARYRSATLNVQLEGERELLRKTKVKAILAADDAEDLRLQLRGKCRCLRFGSG
jgi:hypothetical protein